MTTTDSAPVIEPASRQDPVALIDQVIGRSGTVLLDGAGGHPGSVSLLFHDPISELIAHAPGQVSDVLAQVEAVCREGYHVAGYLSYEAGYAAWEDRFPVFRTEHPLPGGLPLAWFGVFEEHHVLEADLVERWAAEGEGVLIPDLHPAEEAAVFKQRVQDVRALIHEGDVYQINHTTRFVGSFEGDPARLYRSVRKRQPVAFGGFLRIGDVSVLSFSPELFFQQAGRRMETEPMKGTAPRGTTPEQDYHFKKWLGTDEKNQAENLMIVDLLRNDLSMISEPGSVVVPDRFRVQSLPSVHQMTSRIQSTLREEVDFEGVMRALFPCGSITGAPKLRAMQRIAALETGPRGVYCGAIGYVTGAGAERRSVFSVAIRTAVLQGTDLTLGAGGGIVWDSDPEEEWRETLLKTRFFSSSPAPASLQLIETMRADEAGRIPWLSWHIDRLKASAAALGFRLDPGKVESALEARISGNDAEQRIRLLLASGGEVMVESRDITPLPDGPLPVCLTDVRIASGHPRYRHKTTDRGPYEAALAYAAAHGCYDGLLTNERGEVTEGAITNLFIRKGENWYTPPTASGLLPGVGRRVFMLEHAVQERILYPSDLATADEIRLTNAVIGQRRAHYVMP